MVKVLDVDVVEEWHVEEVGVVELEEEVDVNKKHKQKKGFKWTCRFLLYIKISTHTHSNTHSNTQTHIYTFFLTHHVYITRK